MQRTRRISCALTSFRERLERPVSTREVLLWRLRGPVGILALKSAVVREARSDAERQFLLAEIALELARVRPQTAPGSLSVKGVKEEIGRVITELRADLNLNSLEAMVGLRAYVEQAFAEVLP